MHCGGNVLRFMKAVPIAIQCISCFEHVRASSTHRRKIRRSVTFYAVGLLMEIWPFQLRNGTLLRSPGHAKAAVLARHFHHSCCSRYLGPGRVVNATTMAMMEISKGKKVRIFRRRESGNSVVLFYTFCRIQLQATGNTLERFGIGLQSTTKSTSQQEGRIGH
jgi:hypothetical protein